ncbi:MAG: ATP-binding protein [Acidimicrobiales bacterium]
MPPSAPVPPASPHDPPRRGDAELDRDPLGESPARTSVAADPATVGSSPRPRRAGEDPAALARAVELTRRHAALRAATDSDVGEGVADDVRRILEPLATMAVEEFCQRCVIEVAAPWERRIDATQSGAPPLTADDDASTAAELAARVAASGQRERQPADVTRGLPYATATPLRVHDVPFATVIMIRRRDEPGFGPMELTAIDEVAWAAATSLERADLRRRMREAVARADRAAMQLRGLVDTALELRHALEPARVAELVERRGSDIFSAPAHVTWDDAASPGAQRVPLVGADGHARGAIELESAASPDGEDRELLELLAALAQSALEAGELTSELAAREARWRTLVEHAPIGIMETGPDAAVRWWNERAGQLWGWTLDAPATLPARARDEFAELWRRAASSTLPQSRDLVGVEFGGRAHDLRVVAQRIPEAGGHGSVLTLVDDVTEWRLVTEELRHAQTMELRGQVAGSIVHDFNNLLTLISGYADIVRAQVDAPAQAGVDEIAAAAERAAALVAQLQTLGRTQQAAPRVLDPADVLEANAAVIERIVGRTVQIRWDRRGSGLVLVDPDRFEQLVLNLTLNARDAMPDGGTVTFSLAREPGATVARRHDVAPGGDYVVLRVADTGVGMDEATRQRCFEPLFTTKGLKGNGLGLTAARRLMHDSAGSITVESALGQGSTFEVVLPVHGEDGAPSRSESAKSMHAVDVAPHETSPRRAATILVVEDDAAQRRLVESILARLGHTVIAVDSAGEALARGQSLLGLDLLVSDVVLGESSGDAVARQLRAWRPDLGVILVSGTATADVLTGLEGATFLSKPFLPSDLVSAVDALLAAPPQRGVGSNR